MKERPPFEIGELFTTAWKDYRENLWFFLSVVAIIFGLQIFVDVLENAAGGSAVAVLVGFAINVIVGASVARAMLRFIDGKPVRFSHVIPPVQNITWYALFEVIATAFFAICALIAIAAIAVGLGMTIEDILTNQVSVQSISTVAVNSLGFIGLVFIVLFFVVIALTARFAFTTNIIVDRGFTTFKAMRASNLLTKGARWRIILLIFVLAIINMIGAMAMMVGLIVTMPVTLIMFFRAYRALYENLALRTQGDSKESDGCDLQGQKGGDAQEGEQQKERAQSEHATEGEGISKEDATEKVVGENGGDQSARKNGAKDA